MIRILLLLLLPAAISAQDISGSWIGYLETSGTSLPYELVISGSEDKLAGYALTVFTFDGVENIGIKSIKIKNTKGLVSIEDEETIYHNYSTPAKRVKLIGSLHLRTSEGLMTMHGSFFTRSLDMRAKNQNEFTGIIRLQKQNGSKPGRLMAKLNELHLTDSLSLQPIEGDTQSNRTVIKDRTETAPDRPAREVAKRKTEVIQNVFFSSDSLTLSLYDNGEIDGDTVSVLLNDKVIIAHKGLNTYPNQYIIPTTQYASDSLHLVLYAENLGRIAPNTGLLIVQDGRNRTEIRFAGDLQKNAAILFIRKY